jgi:hypothetical protein
MVCPPPVKKHNGLRQNPGVEPGLIPGIFTLPSNVIIGDLIVTPLELTNILTSPTLMVTILSAVKFIFLLYIKILLFAEISIFYLA